MDGKSKSRRLFSGLAIGSVTGLSLFFLWRGVCAESGLDWPQALTSSPSPTYLPFSKEPVDRTPASRIERLAEKTSDSRSESDPKLTLAQALKNDDVCEVARALSGARSDFAAAGLLPWIGHSLGPFNELVSATGPLRGQPLLNSRQRSTRFFNALLLADLLSGVRGASVDLDRARSILQDLEHEDPGNGAYAYFRLAVESKQGRDESELQETIHDIARADRFDSYLSSFARELHRLGWETPSLHLFVRSVLANLPVPKYDVSRDILRSAVAESRSATSVRMDVRAIARLLVQEGTRAERGYQSYGFLPIEYEAGRSLWRQSVDITVEPLPPNFREISAAKENLNPTELWPDDQAVNIRACQRQAYEDYFAKYRFRF